MLAVSFQNVKKQFAGAGYPALVNVSIDIEAGEFVTVLGSSGCGKTTFIKMVNRLYDPDSGTVRLFGEDVSEKDPVQLRRGIGYVIQQIGLFPHMTIKANISVIPNILKWDKTKIERKVDEMLSLVELAPDEFRDRYPAQLSGGQQQRVGLARALICDPKVMLLDEPFGAVDAITRENLQNELKRLHAGTDKTYIFVTHDFREAIKLGTKIIIMNQGRILQYDSPENVLSHPKDPFIEELIRTTGVRE